MKEDNNAIQDMNSTRSISSVRIKAWCCYNKSVSEHEFYEFILTFDVVFVSLLFLLGDGFSKFFSFILMIFLIIGLVIFLIKKEIRTCYNKFYGILKLIYLIIEIILVAGLALGFVALTAISGFGSLTTLGFGFSLFQFVIFFPLLVLSIPWTIQSLKLMFKKSNKSDMTNDKIYQQPQTAPEFFPNNNIYIEK